MFGKKENDTGIVSDDEDSVASEAGVDDETAMSKYRNTRCPWMAFTIISHCS